MPSASEKLALGVDRFPFGHDLVEPFMPHDDGVEDRFLVKGELVLAQDRHPLPGADGDVALIRLELAGEDLEKGRFSGAVGADEPIAVSRGELDVDVFEDDPLAIGEGYV